MTRSFVRALSQYLQVEAAPVTDMPFTMACWFQTSNVADAQVLMWLGDSGEADEMYYLSIDGSQAGDPVRALRWHGGSAAYGGIAAGKSSLGTIIGVARILG